MNYIKRLEKENANYKRMLDKVAEEMRHLNGYLASSKFDKPDDWVRTWEVRDKLTSWITRINWFDASKEETV